MSYHCPTCGHSLQGQLATFEVRQRIALHRQAHERTERRRAQWRASKRRARELREGEVIGWLHSLGCGGQRHKGNQKCVPIPCYDRPAARMGTTGVSGESDRLTRGAASVLTPPASRRSSSGVRR
jgi:hypothetical protein